MWLDVEFPRRIALGAVVTPGWQVTVTSTTAGFESRNLDWTQARHEFDVSLAVRTASDYLIVKKHFNMARAQLKSFAIRDFLDHRCEQSDGFLVATTGGYQLYKRYGSGPDAYERKITRPENVTIYQGGVPGVGFDVDMETGIVTGPGSPGPGAEELGWSGKFFVPVRYDIDKLPGQAVQKHGGPDGELLVSVSGILLVEVRE